MSIKDTLSQIFKISEIYKIDKPYIVGGVPRDIFLQKKIKTPDIDITTNSADVLRLGILTADHLNVPFELSDDGRLEVFADTFNLDFSSNFISDAVIEYIEPKHKAFAEAFSRDFTINTLHRELNDDKFFDPTGMAVRDIKRKIIRTPVPPEITLKDDPKRIYRAINLAVRYDFDIDDAIVQFAISNNDLFADIKDKYITSKIGFALNQNSEKTIFLLKRLELFKNVPLVGSFKDYLIENKMLSEYLAGEAITKQANIANNWQDYSLQGPEYKKIEDFWKTNYLRFGEHSSPSFHSWARWYMSKYRGIWNRNHKGPDEVLRLMNEEMLSNKDGKEYDLKNGKDFEPTESYSQPITISNTDKDLNGKSSIGGHYMSNVLKSKNADITNITDATKSFIRILGDTAKQMGAGTPYITSGYRSIERQAKIMLNNWLANGGMKGGRRYMTNLYGDEYGGSISDIFEKYKGTAEALSHAVSVVGKHGGRHTKNPAEAIDLRVTPGIADVLFAIKNSGRFDMQILDETSVPGPHWHISVYKDNGVNSERIKRISNRKQYLINTAANTYGKIEGE